jgi:hypothetical protein
MAVKSISQIIIVASFKTFQPEVCAYLFKVKSKIPDFEREKAKISTTFMEII